MSRARFVPILGFLAVASLLAARPSFGSLDVEVWTNRGGDAVYKPGELLEISARTSTDAYLLVYEIDTEGYVRVLFPFRGSSGSVEGRKTNKIPSENSGLELVVEETTGMGYIVAVASQEPLRRLPWYLRPYDEQADALGYQDTLSALLSELDRDPQDPNEEGVTKDGQIVGDPFVAMERIRRELFDQPDDTDGFATAYTTYYVHERVKYPRYLCNDCHRPGLYSWWDGWDPYYATCSAFTFRVNWNWYWGAPYWCGYVPYYVYTYLPSCPPRYYVGGTVYYSSWDGSSKWNSMWGGPLVRYKTPPPAGYEAPSKYREGGATANRTPPGFLAGGEGLRDRVVRPTPVSSRRGGGNQVMQRSRTLTGSTGRMIRRSFPDGRPARDVVNPERSGRRFSRSSDEPGGRVVREGRRRSDRGGRGDGDGGGRGEVRSERPAYRPAPQRDSPPPPSRGSDAPRVESPRGNNSPPSAPRSSPGRSGGGGGAGHSGGGRGGFGGGGRR
jgi:hypothetical protein